MVICFPNDLNKSQPCHEIFLEPLGEVKGTVTQWWLWMFKSEPTACTMAISAGTLCACTARRNHPLPAAAAAAARR